MKQVKRALSKIRRGYEELDAAIRTELPGRTNVRWERGRYIQRGTIIDHGYSGRVKVENEKTGARLWLHVSALVHG